LLARQAAVLVEEAQVDLSRAGFDRWAAESGQGKERARDTGIGERTLDQCRKRRNRCQQQHHSG